MAAIPHHTFKLRQEERNTTDPLCTLHTRDQFYPKILGSLLSTGALVVGVGMCGSVSIGVEGVFLYRRLSKPCDRANLSDQQSLSHTLLYTSAPENLSETPKTRQG